MGNRVIHISKPKTSTGGHPNGFTYCGQIIRHRDRVFADIEAANKNTITVIRPCKKCLNLAAKITAGNEIN